MRRPDEPSTDRRRNAGADGKVIGQYAIPAGPVGVTLAWASIAEPLPASMLDLDPREIVALKVEPDLDFSGIGSVGPDVPEVAEPPGRLPHGDLTPLDLPSGGRSFEDPTTRTALEHDPDTWFGRHRVVHRPPARGTLSPEIEGVRHWTPDIEGHPERLDHRFRPVGLVFSASSLNRVAASPHTSSRIPDLGPSFTQLANGLKQRAEAGG
jgi:hypothetical protein